MIKLLVKEVSNKLPTVVVNNPILTLSVLALLIPIVLLYGASKFSSASNEGLIFFSVLSFISLSYAIWVLVLFTKRVSDDQDKS